MEVPSEATATQGAAPMESTSGCAMADMISWGSYSSYSFSSASAGLESRVSAISSALPPS